MSIIRIFGAPGARTGCAFIEYNPDDENIRIQLNWTIRQVKKKDKWTSCEPRRFYNSRYYSTEEALVYINKAFCVKGVSGLEAVNLSQTEHRGYWQAVCDRFNTPIDFITDIELRHIIHETYGYAWPAERDEKKALAMRILKKMFKTDASYDQAAAALCAIAAIKSGRVSL